MSSLPLLPVAAAPAVAERERGFWQRHLFVPLAAYASAMLWARGLHGDFWLADRIYAAGGHAWALHANAWVEHGLHVIGKRVSAAAWLLVVANWFRSLRQPRLAAWRRPLGYLALSVPLATGVVALAKTVTAIDCPWDLLRYGGTHVYRGLFDAHPVAAGGSCFPAGHASAGYAWIALYFFFAAVRPRWRGWGLGIGLAAGAVFGAAQQLRGAHFLSHDLTSLAICWTVAVSLQWALLREGARA
jgi:membrane-associated PAP2 superfamily phosphatase